jgi:hypothetical protein
VDVVTDDDICLRILSEDKRCDLPTLWTGTMASDFWKSTIRVRAELPALATTASLAQDS